MKRHFEEFARQELRGSGIEDEIRRREIIREHARAFQRETRELRLELQPIFFETASAGQQDEPLNPAPSDRAGAIERLYQLASFHERVVRLALALSSEDRNPNIKSIEFLRSLKVADRLASVIQDWE